MREFISLSALIGLFGAFMVLNGCDAPAFTPSSPIISPFNPHDVPLKEADFVKLRDDVAKFSAAVDRIKSYQESIRNEMKSGLPANPLIAHRALDELDKVLEWLPEIANKSGVASKNWRAVTTTSQELRELFNVVHTNLDNKQPHDYGAVEIEIGERIAKLEGFIVSP